MPATSVPRSTIPVARAGIDVSRATACSRVEHRRDPLGEQARGVVGAAEREEVRAAVGRSGHRDRRSDHARRCVEAFRRVVAGRRRTGSRGPRRGRGRGRRRADPRRWPRRSRRPTGRATARCAGARPVRRAARPTRRRTTGPVRVGELGAQPIADGIGSRRALLASPGPASVSVSRKVGISSNRNVDPSEKWTPSRLVANIGWSARPSSAAASANSRLRDQPSGAWGMLVSVLRCTGRPDARAMAQDERAVLVVVTDEEAARDELDRAAAELGEHACQRDQLVVVCVVRRDPATVVRDVQLQL